MESERIHDLRFIQYFLTELQKAGFGRGLCNASRVIASLQETKSPVLRQFYLAAMGMGTFRFKRPKIVDMRGPSAEITDRYEYSPWYGHPCPAGKNSDFAPRFDLRKASLRSPLRPTEDRVVFTELIGRLAKKRFGSRGTFWHACWLFNHQECIPPRWIAVLEKGGKIIFPRVPLFIMAGEKPLDKSDAFYPYLHTGKDMDILFSVKPHDEIEVIRGRDFIAHIPEVK